MNSLMIQHNSQLNTDHLYMREHLILLLKITDLLKNLEIFQHSLLLEVQMQWLVII